MEEEQGCDEEHHAVEDEDGGKRVSVDAHPLAVVPRVRDKARVHDGDRPAERVGLRKQEPPKAGMIPLADGRVQEGAEVVV